MSEHVDRGINCIATHRDGALPTEIENVAVLTEGFPLSTQDRGDTTEVFSLKLDSVPDIYNLLLPDDLCGHQTDRCGVESTDVQRKDTLTFCEKYSARGNVTLSTKAGCSFEVIN